jgi:hypothetical protein
VCVQVLPEHDTTLGKTVASCAIIGSSGHMLKYQKGEEIDAHDLVFRFNSAPTHGYVGTTYSDANRTIRVWRRATENGP